MNNTIKAVLLAAMLAAVCASVMVTEAVDAVYGSGDVAEGDATGTPVAQVGDETFATLQEAFDKGKDSAMPVTIELLGDFTGPGVKVQSGSNVILDFNGYTYTNNGGVGSTGTETNGFQLLRDSTVVLKNGTMTASTPDCKVLIQNYCDLTLDNVVLNGSSYTQYVVSNNCGDTKFINGTVVNSFGDNVAFDVYYWPSNSYSEGVTVTIEDATINGKIEYATDGSPAAKDFIGKAMLRINGGSINGVISTNNCFDSDPDISITGGTFSSDVSEYVTGGYWVDNGDGTFSVSETKPIEPPSYDDEDLPPFIPTQPAEEDDTVTIVACAAAAAVAAILAVFLVIDRKG